MKKSSIALTVVLITLVSGFAYGQGQAYSPLGLDLSGYWVQLGRQQDAGLGTAAGDLTAERLNIGYFKSILLFGGLIAIVAIAHFRFRLNAILAFWLAYILTRPLGASIGDFMSQPRDEGGLGLGTVVTSALFLSAIVVLVIYLARTKADVTSPAAAPIPDPAYDD